MSKSPAGAPWARWRHGVQSHRLHLLQQLKVCNFAKGYPFPSASSRNTIVKILLFSGLSRRQAIMLARLIWRWCRFKRNFHWEHMPGTPGATPGALPAGETVKCFKLNSLQNGRYSSGAGIVVDFELREPQGSTAFNAGRFYGVGSRGVPRRPPGSEGDPFSNQRFCSQQEPRNEMKTLKTTGEGACETQEGIWQSAIGNWLNQVQEQ